MRLISVRLQSYRIHQDSGTIRFDGRRNLITGPNETGKSTLAEALHRALFLKAKGDTADHRAMQPVLGGSPGVELHFEARGKIWLLRKRFGRSGTTSLTTEGAAALSGEAAEAELAKLLGVDAGLSGKAALAQWPHLWVWQGQSGDDPSPHTSTQQAGLLQRLQDSGGAAAMQSERDSRLAGFFAAATRGIFGLNGNPLTSSGLAKATIAFNQAETRRAEALRKSENLLRTVMDFESAGAVLTETAASLEALRRQHLEVSGRQEKITALRHREASQQGLAEAAAARLNGLERTELQISRLRESLQKLESDLTPGNSRTPLLEAARDQAAAHAGNAAAAFERAAAARETAREQRDLAAAWGAQFETAARLRELSEAMARVESLAAGLATLRQQAAQLPNVDDARLRRLQQLESAHSRAGAALQAMATRLEVLSADSPVNVGDSPLAPGGHRVLTHDTEISYGPGLKLRIRPGGGVSLEEARQTWESAAAALREALAVCGLSTVEEAAAAAARRVDFAGRIKAAEAGLDSLSRAVSAKTLEAAREAHFAAEAEVSRRSDRLPGWVPPASAGEAAAARLKASRELEDAESAAFSTKAGREVAGQDLAAAEQVLAEHVRSLHLRNRELADLQAQLRLLLEQHGSDETRAGILAESREESRGASENLAACRQALAELQPHLIPGDLERLTRALEQTNARKNEAETKRAVALSGLRSDGSEDPAAEVALASAQVETAAETLAAARRHAGALRLLDELFTAEQRALADQFTQPLADRISGYLECLFGPGSRASLILEDNKFTGLHLASRPGQESGALNFASLSGGTREQLAAAVRLAVAEILSADHEGCLPVVFDDAFTHSDPDRILTLQRMLDLAASRGLQIIVLTCHPAAYAGLGAATTLLTRPPAVVAS